MKKILYIILLLFTCVSCDEWVGNYNKVKKERRQKSIEEHINDTTDLKDNLYNVKFDGHLYVVYKEQAGYGYGLGAAMVHSPNCECHKEKLNDEKIN